MWSQVIFIFFPGNGVDSLEILGIGSLELHKKSPDSISLLISSPFFLIFAFNWHLSAFYAQNKSKFTNTNPFLGGFFNAALINIHQLQ